MMYKVTLGRYREYKFDTKAEALEFCNNISPYLNTENIIELIKPKTEDKGLLDKRSCIYRKELTTKTNGNIKHEGQCQNERCVNYQYECIRPERCKKQKPKMMERGDD